MTLYRSKALFAVALAAAVVVFGTLDKDLIVRPLQSLAVAADISMKSLLLKPVFFAAAFGEKYHLAEDNRTLEDQFNSLVAYCGAETSSLETENRELSAALGRQNKVADREVATAFIIGKPPVAPYGTILVDVGSRSNVEVKDLAVVGKYLVGEVISVQKENSVIRLFGLKGDSRVLQVGDQRLPLRGEGTGAGVYTAEYINKNSDLSGQDVRLGEFPQYLYAKVIGSVGADYKITLQSPVNILEIASVQIVHNESK